jgi:hypothetical protein
VRAQPLGDATELHEDPYVLAGSWLDIQASSPDEGLVAVVLNSSVKDARRAVDSARKFANAARCIVGVPMACLAANAGSAPLDAARTPDAAGTPDAADASSA